MTAARVAGNVPLELTSFVGRRTELAETKQLLGASRLVTLTGIGGVGKTRLALRVAAETHRAFADGVWLIELGELHDTHRLAAATAGALGFDLTSTTCTLDDLVVLLRPLKLLLVLDNCEHLIAGIAAAADGLLRGCPHLKILATSREPLGLGGEVVLPVRPLTVPDPSRPCSIRGLPSYEAIMLFTERAGAAIPGFDVTEDNKDIVARICQRLDGLPLLIELAAARLRSMSPRQFLHRLSERHRLLTMGTRGAPARHQSLRACIDWSHDLCTPRERNVWGRLSVFAGVFDLGAAEAICAGELTPSELADAVTALVDKSILIPERSSGVVRYRLLETLRDYGREHLQESGDCQTQQRRHRDWFTQLALKADSDWHSPRQAEWIHCLDREYANLCAAMTFGMSDPSSAPFTLRIANALRRYWISRGLLNEGRHWLRHARACQIERPSRGHVTALSAEGLLAGLQGEITDFVALVAQARDCAARLADPVADRLVSNAEGQLALLSGDATSAAAHFEYTLDTSRRSERLDERLDERLEALLGLVVASGLCGHREQAIDYGEKVLRTEVLAETTYQARALTNVASVIWREEPARASELLNQGLRLSRHLNSPLVALACLDTAACLSGAANQSQRAAVLLGAARSLRQSMGCQGLNTHTEEELGEHRLRLVLGEHAFTKALHHGERLNFEKAVAYALDETTSRKRQANSCPDGGLTVRERQVANLVGHGLTNRAIAEKLVISQRTAQGHVEHILTKLGYTSRVQIAAWIADHDDDNKP